MLNGEVLVGAIQTRNLNYSDIHRIAIGLGKVAFRLLSEAVRGQHSGGKIKP
jgi:hypothetical protein